MYKGTSCVSTNEKSSFYSTHLQVRFTIVSENRTAAISMHGRHLSFIEIHNVQEILTGIGKKRLMLWLAAPYGWWQPCQLPELLLCFSYCIDVTFWHTYTCTHKNSNMIPALSEFQSDKDRQEALVGPRIIQCSGILGQ